MRGSKITQVATGELGYKETPSGSNKTKFGNWFGVDGVAWCAMFVSWCYDKAGYPLGNLGYLKGFAGCQSGYLYFLKKKWLTKTPVEGDIVLFDWNGDKRYDHTGIFLRKIDDLHFESIEGNTAVGNDSNGGQVMKRIRTYNVAIFAHPILPTAKFKK